MPAAVVSDDSGGFGNACGVVAGCREVGGVVVVAEDIADSVAGIAVAEDNAAADSAGVAASCATASMEPGREELFRGECSAERQPGRGSLRGIVPTFRDRVPTAGKEPEREE